MKFFVKYITQTIEIIIMIFAIQKARQTIYRHLLYIFNIQMQLSEIEDDKFQGNTQKDQYFGFQADRTFPYPTSKSLDQHFVFQNLDNDLNSLTMTRQATTLANSLYKLPYFVWIDSNLQTIQLQAISKHLKEYITFYRELEQAKHLIESQSTTNIIVISSLKSIEKVEAYCNNIANVQNILLCCERKVKYYPKIKKLKKAFHDPKQVLKELEQNLQFYYTKKEFPNFLSIEDNKSQSNMLLRTFKLMTKQTSNKGLLNEELIRIAKLCGFRDETHFQEFRNDFSRVNLESEKIIKWYTRNTFLYEIVNGLIRVGKHPSQVYCLQPFIKQIFTVVRNQYMSADRRQRGRFQVYRGGYIGEIQLQYLMKNKNCIFQNLGFFSTSKNRVEAEKFVKNVFFQVSVENNEQMKENDFGYADISKISVYQQEQQIIFNLLNCFKLVDIIPNKDINGKKATIIQMQYGFTKSNCSQSGPLAAYEKDSEILLQYQRNMKIQQLAMGDLLLRSDQLEEGCQIYWYQYLKLASKQEDKIRGYKKLAEVQVIKGDSKSAIHILKYLEKRISKTFPESQFLDRKAKDIYFFNIMEIYFLLGKAYLEKRDFAAQYNREQLTMGLSYLEKCCSSNFFSFIQLERQIEVLLQIGKAQLLLKNYQSSLSYLIQCKQMVHKNCGEVHQIFARACHYIGYIYNEMGKEAISREHFSKSVQILQGIAGSSAQTLYIFNKQIAEFYRSKLNHKMTLQYLEKCVHIQLMKKNKQVLAQIYREMGFVYSKIGNYSKALEYYNNCCQIFASDGETLQYSKILRNIGLLYSQKNELEKSLQFYRQCQKIQAQVGGGKTNQYAITLRSIGQVYLKTQGGKKALQFYKKCEEIQLSTIGENHPQYSSTLRNIGIAYFKMKDNQQALRYYEKCKEIQQKTIGKSDAYYAKTLRNIGLVYSKMKKYKKALEYFFICQNIQIQLVGEDSDDLAITYRNIGKVYSLLKQFEQALKYLKKCEEIQSSTIGENRSFFAITLSMIGYCYCNLELYEDAFSYFEKCKKIQIDTIGQGHSHLATTLRNIGLTYFKKNKYNQALEYYQKCQEIQLATIGQSNNQYVTTLRHQALVYRQLGEYHKSLEKYSKCEQIQNSMPTIGQNHADTGITLRNMGEVYQKMKDYKSALECYERCQYIHEKLYGKMGQNSTTQTLIRQVTQKIKENKKKVKYISK